MPSRPARRASDRRRDIVAIGLSGLAPIPTVGELEALSAAERHDKLDDLRGQLYELASAVADRTLRRARDHCHRHPPYGLVRSLFTQMRVVSVDPGPYQAGSITSFTDLGRAYVDTLVFHLDAELAFISSRQGPRWLTGRMAELLALFRIDGGPEGKARLRDAFSFMYGGLHFGASTCVQAVEAMNRVLDAREPLALKQKAAILSASVRVVHQLAALNLTEIPAAYSRLQDGGVWFGAEHFVVDRPNEGLIRLDLHPEVLSALESGPGPRYTTRGCPARHSPTGGPGAITVMWRWSVELAAATGLLGQPVPGGAPSGGDPGGEGDRSGG